MDVDFGNDNVKKERESLVDRRKSSRSPRSERLLSMTSIASSNDTYLPSFHDKSPSESFKNRHKIIEIKRPTIESAMQTKGGTSNPQLAEGIFNLEASTSKHIPVRKPKVNKAPLRKPLRRDAKTRAIFLIKKAIDLYLGGRIPKKMRFTQRKQVQDRVRASKRQEKRQMCLSCGKDERKTSRRPAPRQRNGKKAQPKRDTYQARGGSRAKTCSSYCRHCTLN